MTKIRITKQFNFEMAHALSNYDGLCKNIHGHSYKLDVTVIGCPNEDSNSPKIGMIIDFTDLKNIVNNVIINKLDHALVLNVSTSPELVNQLKNNFDKIILVSYQPTTENFLSHFAKELTLYLPDHVALHSLRLRETDSSYAEWHADDN